MKLPITFVSILVLAATSTSTPLDKSAIEAREPGKDGTVNPDLQPVYPWGHYRRGENVIEVTPPRDKRSVIMQLLDLHTGTGNPHSGGLSKRDDGDGTEEKLGERRLVMEPLEEVAAE